MAHNLNGVFERMIDDMCAMAANDTLLDECMGLSEEALRHIPLRYRIVALGFVKHFTLQELNDKLASQGCPTLYLRNFWEATLIFAFQHRYSYEDWKRVRGDCADIFKGMEANAWFRDGRITYDELERYVLGNSEAGGDLLATRRHTEYLEGGLAALPGDVNALRAFLRENVRSFSAVREKTRYYFCKYLYYYLNTRIEDYFRALRRGVGVDEALSALLPLKVVTLLKRNVRMPEEEKRARIRASVLSCGGIFDEFNYFYFDYVSVDWIEVLLECYGSVEEIPAPQRKRIAEAFRQGRSELANRGDEEVIERCAREIEAREDEGDAQDNGHKSRAGEHAVRKYIQGTLDIDRTALICFLLFFGSEARLPREQRLNRERMDEILRRCGYSPLDDEGAFDWFVEEFLESRDPREVLAVAMQGYAQHSENSFLYHLYNNSTRYQDELMRVMIRSGK